MARTIISVIVGYFAMLVLAFVGFTCAYLIVGQDGAFKPGLYEGELNLGICLLRSKNPAEAAPHLKSAVEQKPKDPRAAYYYAQAVLDSGQDAEAAFANAASLATSKV